jgi:hypothetical protein
LILVAPELPLNTSCTLFPTVTLLAPVAATFCGVELTDMLPSPVTAVPAIFTAAVTVPLEV